MLLRKIDSQGFFIEDCIFDKLPMKTETVNKIRFELQPVYDTDGNFVEEITAEIPYTEEVETGLADGYVETEVPQGLYKPKWTGTEWIEGMSPEEIAALQNIVPEPTLEERVTVTETKVVTIEEVIDVLVGGTTA